jgi:hypothetical protein
MEFLHVIYNTWLGQFMGAYADLKKMGKWAGNTILLPNKKKP